MRRGLIFLLTVIAIACVGFATSAVADDIELAKKSTIEDILKRGELRVGFEAGYLPFEMADKKGNFIGFDIDMAKEMAKAMGVKFVPVNTAWDGIIPALVTKKFDIIISGMTISKIIAATCISGVTTISVTPGVLASCSSCGCSRKKLSRLVRNM